MFQQNIGFNFANVNTQTLLGLLEICAHKLSQTDK